ncbi:VWA domain-containing protein [Phaeobacter sp.]|uniref:vWA domain-containing protein n=1 Tax=Phaeobacter sp. TaxID=1902409 RepID=UPI0025DD185E|nr:VWA domain-containing protein [Phaeobacter sp.]
MSRITKFTARDPGASARMAGFMAHLRANGLRIGPAETQTALEALSAINAADPSACCLALKSVCTGTAQDAARFEALFDSYWRNGGRVSRRVIQSPQVDPKAAHPSVHSSREVEGAETSGAGQQRALPDQGGENDSGSAAGEGRLMAVRSQQLARKDLRDLVQKEDILAAERIARRLGAALRDRRSRRRRLAHRGRGLHFRKTIRASLATGGVPVRLFRKSRPDRPVKLVALCDVSGSMSDYARVFLAYLAGVMRADPTSDAYVFHTRLVRITDALRDKDALRALGRLSVMAEGFGGGSRIGASLDHFARGYARRFVDGRTVVIILSDGYDTEPAEAVASALARLRRRGCRILWLNPMKGWDGYAPIAQAMAAALPHLDMFRAANRLEDLAALEPELAAL